jgi:hypothetical protein
MVDEIPAKPLAWVTPLAFPRKLLLVNLKVLFLKVVSSSS